MTETFSERAGGDAREDELLPEELSGAERLVEESYGPRAWIRTIPCRRRGRGRRACQSLRGSANANKRLPLERFGVRG
jgi:hypothetical protein